MTKRTTGLTCSHLSWALTVCLSLVPPSLAQQVDSREWIGYAVGYKTVGKSPSGLKKIDLIMGLCSGSGMPPDLNHTYSRIVTDQNLDYSALQHSLNVSNNLWGLDAIAKMFPVSESIANDLPGNFRCDSSNKQPHVVLYVNVTNNSRHESSLGWGTGGIGPTDGQCHLDADNATITVVPTPRGNGRSEPARVNITCSSTTSATIAYAKGSPPYVPVGNDNYVLRVNGFSLPQSYDLSSGANPLELTVLPLQNTNLPGPHEGHAVITVTYH